MEKLHLGAMSSILRMFSIPEFALSMAAGFMAAPTSALGLFVLFHVLASIGRASFPTPPTHWGWEPDTTHPAGSSGGVLGGSQ